MITNEASWPAIEMEATEVTFSFTKSFLFPPFILCYLTTLVVAQILDTNMTNLTFSHNDVGAEVVLRTLTFHLKKGHEEMPGGKWSKLCQILFVFPCRSTPLFSPCFLSHWLIYTGDISVLCVLGIPAESS